MFWCTNFFTSPMSWKKHINVIKINYCMLASKGRKTCKHVDNFDHEMILKRIMYDAVEVRSKSLNNRLPHKYYFLFSYFSSAVWTGTVHGPVWLTLTSSHGFVRSRSSNGSLPCFLPAVILWRWYVPQFFINILLVFDVPGHPKYFPIGFYIRVVPGCLSTSWYQKINSSCRNGGI